MERGGGAMMTLLSLPLDLGGPVMKLTVDVNICRGHGRCYRSPRACSRTTRMAT